MLAGAPAEVTGDGRQTSDFTYVANAVRACRLAAAAGPAAVGEAVNVGCDDRISVLDLVELVNDLLPRRVDPVFIAARPGDVRDSQAAVAKADRLLGYRPLVPVRDGVAATVRWFAGEPTPTREPYQDDHGPAIRRRATRHRRRAAGVPGRAAAGPAGPCRPVLGGQGGHGILASGVLTNGPSVRRLEERAADYVGVRHCVAVCSCTAGLMLVLRASGLSGDVVLPSFTFSATAHAVAWNGLRPTFADIGPDDLLLDPSAAAVRPAPALRR